MSRKDYRPDIDGLRAMAVVPVIWYHSGLSGMPGGFIGVDIFFCISGFLITSLIQAELETGVFSFQDFYARRIRRLAPALLVVIAAVILGGYAVFLPYELDSLGRSAIAVLLLVPNLHFWLEGGYFGLGNQSLPLLHTWSLGVEGQFYLFYPPFIVAASRLNCLRPAITLAAAASLVLCVFATPISPSASFYLLPTRAWELALGGMLAVGVVTIPDRLKAIASISGVSLIVGGICFVQEGLDFPGWIAAIPVLGAGLIIASGPATPTNRLLASRPLVWIGLISYSLYLWHWPIFVFLRHFLAEPVLPVRWALLGMTSAVVMAWISYRFIERPARFGAIQFGTILAQARTGALLVTVAAAVPALARGLPQRLDQPVLDRAARRNDSAPLARNCVNTPLKSINAACKIGSGPASVLLWGDSHAAAMSQGVAIGLGQPTVVAAMNSCAPVLGWTSSTLSQGDSLVCRKRNDDLIVRINREPALHTVVLAAYWPSHERSGGRQLRVGLDRLVGQLHGKRVIILSGVPDPGFDVPWVSALRLQRGLSPPSWPCPPGFTVAGAEVVDLSGSFCAHRQPLNLFTDSNHPSLTANREIIAPALAQTRR